MSVTCSFAYIRTIYHHSNKWSQQRHRRKQLRGIKFEPTRILIKINKSKIRDPCSIINHISQCHLVADVCADEHVLLRYNIVSFLCWTAQRMLLTFFKKSIHEYMCTIGNVTFVHRVCMYVATSQWFCRWLTTLTIHPVTASCLSRWYCKIYDCLFCVATVRKTKLSGFYSKLIYRVIWWLFCIYILHWMKTKTLIKILFYKASFFILQSILYKFIFLVSLNWTKVTFIINVTLVQVYELTKHFYAEPW